MKNIYKKVLTLAMGLLLTVSASAQVKTFAKDDAAKRAIIENMDTKVAMQKSDVKAAAVTITADSTTATTAYLSFAKNEETVAYAIILDSYGLLDMILSSGMAASVEDAIIVLYSNNLYEYAAVGDTSIVAGGYVPGTTNAAYALAFDNAGGYAVSSVEFTMGNQGGSGLAEVELTVENITHTSFDFETEMNDQVNYYYFAYCDSTIFAGYPADTVIAAVMAQTSPYGENIGGTIDELLPGTTFAIYIVPVNIDGTIGTFVERFVRVTPQGGTGTAEVTLTVSNITNSSCDVATEMNDQTNIYYFAYAETATFAGATQDQIVDAITSQMSPYTENVSGTIGGGQDPLQTNVSYTLYVIPFNANNELGTFVAQEVVPGGVAINDVNGISYSIYPNPASSVLNVEGENIDCVEMYNAMGQRVMNQNVNGTAAQFNVNSLAKGAYILKVYSNGQESVQKVVIK